MFQLLLVVVLPAGDSASCCRDRTSPRELYDGSELRHLEQHDWRHLARARLGGIQADGLGCRSPSAGRVVTVRGGRSGPLAVAFCRGVGADSAGRAIDGLATDGRVAWDGGASAKPHADSMRVSG